MLRNEQARRRREDLAAEWLLPADRFAPAADAARDDGDDTLILLFMCCHPSLSQASQIALTLRALGGLTTAEVGRALLVPEDTVTGGSAERSRRSGRAASHFDCPPAPNGADRLAVVLHVLYLIFNEGYVSTAGPSLQRVDLAAEAIRLARMVRRLLPDDPEVAGLLALMLLTDARRHARTGPAGELVPMAEQDRGLWDRAEVAEGTAIVAGTLDRGVAGPYALQAAIAAVHDEAPSGEATDWIRIERLYEQLATGLGHPRRGTQPRRRGRHGSRRRGRPRGARGPRGRPSHRRGPPPLRRASPSARHARPTGRRARGV